MSDAVVEMKDLVKRFAKNTGIVSQILGQKAASITAVDHVNLSLGPGEIMGIVGESGCGKTTLGKMVSLLTSPTSGSLLIEGQDVASLSKSQIRNMRRTVQIVFQSPYDSLDPRNLVRSIVGQPLQELGEADSNEWQDRVESMLDDVGLRPAGAYMDEYPHRLSGGERQRVAFARAMIIGPKIVVADEPVSMLDVSLQASILNLMLKLREENDTAFLFITHDLSVARYMADRIAIMYLGQVVEMGNTKDIVSNPLHPYSRLLLAAVPRLQWVTENKQSRTRVPTKDPTEADASEEDSCKFAPRCPFATEICYENRPVLEETQDDSFVACHHKTRSLQTPEESLLAQTEEMISFPEK